MSTEATALLGLLGLLGLRVRFGFWFPIVTRPADPLDAPESSPAG